MEDLSTVLVPASADACASVLELGMERVSRLRRPCLAHVDCRHTQAGVAEGKDESMY